MQDWRVWLLMAGAFSPLPLRSWLQRKPDWLDHLTVAALIFALKTFAAAILALFIAFWAGLDEPRWAFLTVFVVAQPNGGLVLAKSFYRILGTIAGVLVTIALVFGLAQYGELFVAALALWMGFCNFAARAVRNFASYGFQLAGYTVAIAGLPAALVPAGAYPLLVGRFTEISLGILCAALVSRLVAAQELLPKLVEQVRSLTRRADRFAALLLDRDADRERVAAERIELTKDYLQIEAMQSSAYFESAEARILNQPLRRLTQAAVNLCAMAEAAASHRDGSPPDPGKSASAGAVLHAGESWPEASAQISALVRAADQRDIDSARVRLRQSMAAFDRGDELPESKIACRFWSDPVPALLAGMRTALAVGITATIWFAIAWPDGPTAVVVAGVLCMLGASMAQPIKITLALAATILISAVPVYATWFYLMPLAVDFPSLAAALAPLSLICAFIIAQPKIGATGLLVIVYFEFASKIENVQAYNAAAFLNSSFAILVGMAVTLVLFATFFPETPAYAARRFRRQLLVHLSGLVGARWRPAARLQCYRQALFERLGATLATVGDEPKAASECVVAALTALSAAQAIGRLRDALAPAILPPAIARQGFQLLTRLSRTLRHPSVCKFSESEEEARLLARHSLAAARDSAEAEKIQALSGIVVACETLGSDLLRGRMLLEEKANARRA